MNKETKDERLIADHFTFLIENHKNDKYPVKSHITIYTPQPMQIKKNQMNGYSQKENFYLPESMTIDDIKAHKYFFDLIETYKNVVSEFLLIPYISENIQHEAGNPHPNKKNTTTTKRKVSKKLKAFMNDYHIQAIVAIGIKTHGQYDYTVFVTPVEDHSTNSNTNDGDSTENDVPIPSFTYSNKKHSFSSIQDNIISKLETLVVCDRIV